MNTRLIQTRKDQNVLFALSFWSLFAFGPALLGVAGLFGPARVLAQSSGARIYVTTTVQKIAPVGSGGCSLQEAIYSSVLHSSFFGNYFGGHGIAIDATDPDHFIATDCVAGTGAGDTIILPKGAVFQLSNSLDGDAYNYMGPTATPMIYSTMTIDASGATLEWIGQGHSRLFAVGELTTANPLTVRDSNGNPLATLTGTGGVTIRNAYIKGFHVKGGDGGQSAGGGLGAGGAIYLNNGTLVVENSTFDSNDVVGGNGGNSGLNDHNLGGGGGGLAGTGGRGFGGGGGGARGNGAWGLNYGGGGGGGGGGGTVFGGGGPNGKTGGAGGLNCGGTGGDQSTFGNNGNDAKCAGGGGGGAGAAEPSSVGLGPIRHGGNGNYGGGGGGGNDTGPGEGNGGHGGFGGGGGGALDYSSPHGATGGSGGFGGGGGAGLNTSGRGGPFGGNAGSTTGGGGGALGGAIFNDGGTLAVHNSTFFNNSVVAGSGVQNGTDAGGAIFSRNGSLKVVNATISGNKSTTAGGGIVAYGDGATANFILDDTIVANNGADECYVGGTVSPSGTGNLIINNGSGGFGACPGVVTTADPGLGALAPPSINGGLTPTMAIAIGSPAMGTADAGTSLPYDQRYADRPQPDISSHTGFDIGAYEVCRRFLIRFLGPALCSEINAPPPPTTTLTMQASPGSEGTTNPAPGTYNEAVNQVVAVQAVANSGFHFTSWTGNVADPANPSTTITMSQAETVTANFAPGAPSADLQVTVNDGKSTVVAGTPNTYTIVVSNAGPGYVTGAVVKDAFPSILSGVTFSASETGGAYGFTLSGSGNINDSVTMHAGSSITYKATGRLSSAATGTLSDTATVTSPSGMSDPNPANNTATHTDTIVLQADLRVTITDGKTSVVPGSTNTYTIVVSNAGPSKVIGAIVQDSFPSTFTGVTYTATQSGGASGFTATGSGNINNIVTLPAGSTITYKATGTISASATGSISDTVTVTPPSGVTDPNLTNNSATDFNTVL